MPRAADGQYEMILENRQVMSIFFVIVVLCGVFFGLGYVVGKNTVAYEPAESAAVAAEGKKSAIASEERAPERRAEAAQPGSDLTFHQSLADRGSTPRLEPEPPRPAPLTMPAETAPVAVAAVSPAGATPATTLPEGSIALQVAALSRQAEADALVSQLRTKGFPAMLVTTQTDSLFRVQVGPFSNTRDADDMKARLALEGIKGFTVTRR
jgi:DedD protein